MTREKPTSLSLWLGARIAKLRKSKGWAQKGLEQMAGFQQGYLSRVENGLITPGLAGLLDLARVFEITVSRLLSGIEDVRRD